MTTLQKTFVGAALAAAIGVGIFEAHQASTWRRQSRNLERQLALLTEQIRQLTQESDAANGRIASAEAEQLNRSRAEVVRVTSLRGSPGFLEKPVEAPPPALATNAAQAATAERIAMGRELGMAVARGEPGAFEKLVELARARASHFRSNNPGMTDNQRADLARETFAPLSAAFEVIAQAASEGNALALDAVMQAALVPELKGQAIRALGKLAGEGSDVAVDTLVNPQKYGLLLSSTVSALRPAAANGNQKAVDALVAVTSDSSHQALWYMAADGLAKAAEAGNAVAIDALIGLSTSTNRSVHDVVVRGLKQAAANQNAKATEALRAMGVQ